ncbi:MAG: hypothetical protein ACRDT6_04475 [Micromonosporaceae bacterium]
MIVGSLVLILAAAGLLVGGLILGNDWMLGGSIVGSLLAAVLLYLGAKQSASAREEARLREQDDEWDDEPEPREGFFDDQPDYPARPVGDARFGEAVPRGAEAVPRHHAEPIERAPTERVPVQRQFGTAEHPTVPEPAHAARGDEPYPQPPADRAARDEAAPDQTAAPEQVGPSTMEATPAPEGPGIADLPTPPMGADIPTPPLGAAVPGAAVPDDPEAWIGGGLDEDDPKDEPPIQRRAARVAAQVARMDTDVFVIDGRPRYHVAGCVHLLGREHEPIPVDEAVELGFSPCSLCEPDTMITGGLASKTRR